MREALGNSLLMNLIVIFSGIVILFFVGIMSYSKAYRVKNRIIEVIEKYETYDGNAQNEISADLKRIGYRSISNKKCSEGNKNSTTYSYCVYEKNDTNNGKYYEVVTYVQFEFPVIGDFITFPVKGETKILAKSYSY